MSLESIAEKILKSQVCNLFFEEVIDNYGSYNGYVKYKNRVSKKELIVDLSGKVVFGGYFHLIQSILKVGNTNYLIARRTHKLLCKYFAEDGSLAFNGETASLGDHVININGSSYMATYLSGFSWEVYDEKGSPVESVAKLCLDPVKKSVSNVNLLDDLYGVCNKAYRSLIGDIDHKLKFFENVVSAVKDRIEEHKESPEMQKKSLGQFIQCLDYFIEHPDETLGFMGGGLIE